MKLVTFDGGRVGRVIEDEIVELACTDMRVIGTFMLCDGGYSMVGA